MEIVEISPAYLAEYAQVSSGFEVRNILTVERLDAGWGWGSGGLRLVEQRVAEPYWKDYDSYDEGRPQDWPKEFDLSPWGFFLQWNRAAQSGARSWLMPRRGFFN
jgi:hypothetical protein